MSSTCRTCSTSSMNRKCTRFHEQKSHQQKHNISESTSHCEFFSRSCEKTAGALPQDVMNRLPNNQYKHLLCQLLENVSQMWDKCFCSLRILKAIYGLFFQFCTNICRGTSSGCTLYIQQHSCGAEKSKK